MVEMVDIFKNTPKEYFFIALILFTAGICFLYLGIQKGTQINQISKVNTTIPNEYKRDTIKPIIKKTTKQKKKKVTENNIQNSEKAIIQTNENGDNNATIN